MKLISYIFIISMIFFTTSCASSTKNSDNNSAKNSNQKISPVHYMWARR